MKFRLSGFVYVEPGVLVPDILMDPPVCALIQIRRLTRHQVGCGTNSGHLTDIKEVFRSASSNGFS